MKILVTGGAGFIGSAVIRHLIGETAHAVVNVDCLTYAGNLGTLTSVDRDPRYAFEKVDIYDGPAVEGLFERHRPDAVMHLAAESHVDRSIDGPAAFMRTNVVGTYTLLEAARRYRAGLSSGRQEAFASTTSRPTRSTALSATPVSSPKRRPTIRARPTRRARRPPTTSRGPGSGPTGCRCSSRTARTTTARTSTPRS